MLADLSAYWRGICSHLQWILYWLMPSYAFIRRNQLILCDRATLAFVKELSWVLALAGDKRQGIAYREKLQAFQYLPAGQEKRILSFAWFISFDKITAASLFATMGLFNREVSNSWPKRWLFPTFLWYGKLQQRKWFFGAKEKKLRIINESILNYRKGRFFGYIM